MVVSLVDMKHGESGVVVDIRGGCGMAQRVRNMGIRAGKRINKAGSFFRWGPQTVLVDRAKVAIGRGMARNILVEVEREDR
jgi:ferrous iron transport protein A